MDLKDFYLIVKNKYDSSELFKDFSLIINAQHKSGLKINLNNSTVESFVNNYSFFPTPTISCGIITFNEEKNIECCLKSLNEKFDKIILLDSYSTDNTINIVKEKFPEVKVFFSKWQNDFSKQRNKIIELCLSDWIYFIDADNEYMSEDNEIRRIIKILNYLEIECVVSPLIIEHNGQFTEDNKRLIPLKKDIAFWGKIHEEPIYLKNSSYPLSFKSKLVVKHNGYNLNNYDLLEKNLRNNVLTKQMIHIEPSNFKWHYYMIRETQEISNNRDDIELLYKKVFGFSEFLCHEPYYLEIKLLWCEFLLKNNRFKELNEEIIEMKPNFPDCLDLDYYQANLFLINSFMKTGKVIKHLEKLIKDSNDGKKFSGINSNNDHLKMTLVKLHFSVANFSSALEYSETILDKDLKKITKEILTI